MACLGTDRRRVHAATCTLREVENHVLGEHHPGNGMMLEPDTSSPTWSSFQHPGKRQFLHTSYLSVLSVLHSTDESSEKHDRDPVAPAITLPFFLKYFLCTSTEWEKGINTILFNTSSCLLSLPCRQHYTSFWHHHCLIHLTYAPEKKCHVLNKNITLWSHSHLRLYSTSHFLLF